MSHGTPYTAAELTRFLAEKLGVEPYWEFRPDDRTNPHPLLWYAKICDLSERVVDRGAHKALEMGTGSSPTEAAESFARKAWGKRVAWNAYGEDRQEFVVERPGPPPEPEVPGRVVFDPNSSTIWPEGQIGKMRSGQDRRTLYRMISARNNAWLRMEEIIAKLEPNDLLRVGYILKNGASLLAQELERVDADSV